MRLRLKRKTVLVILLLIVTGVSGWVILEVFAESQGMNRAFFYFVVTGNGEEEMDGYFGWIDEPELGPVLYSHIYARISGSVDIGNVMLLANASGYETVLVTNPADYDALPPRVAIRNRVILYPNNVPVNFTIIVLEDGYLTVNVHSDYYLRDGWMRSVFKRMLQDVSLSPSILSEFELAVNYRGRYAATSLSPAYQEFLGTGWGDHGYGWLPYEYVLKGLAVDWWSLLKNEWIATGVFKL